MLFFYGRVISDTFISLPVNYMQMSKNENDVFAKKFLAMMVGNMMEM